MMSTDRLILASASPRRSEILNQIGVDFTVDPANIDETCLANETATQFVTRMAQEKARAVCLKRADNIPVLGADTIVTTGAKIFGKPENFDDAWAMLRALSGNSHQVFTAVAIDNGEKSAVLMSKTVVKFRTISHSECLSYWHSGEPQDKAGAYAIQGYGAVFVERIEGSYSGVVGLPIAETSMLLKQFDVPIWHA